MNDQAGNYFTNDSSENQEYALGLLNSCVADYFMEIKGGTLNFTADSFTVLPIYYKRNREVREYVKSNLNIACQDWDSFETSWDFQRHPLVPMAVPVNDRLSDAFAYWAKVCDNRFNQLRANEEELNRIFIDIYGLQDELTPEVEDKDVTVRRADLGRDIRSLISYAVGCMFGRYSIYKDGLLFAGERYSHQAFIEKLNERPGTLSEEEIHRAYHHEGIAVCELFSPDNDNIIPICDDDYFDDDITGRFVKFIEVVYGKDTLEENLKFIADALGGKGSPREVIRSYFLNDFYADHLKIYQKRPIYWLFDSGRKNGFKALTYMHRYQPDTIARIRTDYVHEQQSRYRTAIADLEQRINGASTSERVKLSKHLT